MSDTTGIEAKIHAKADAELEAAIGDRVQEFKRSINHYVPGSSYLLHSDLTFKVRRAGEEQQVNVSCEKVLSALKERVIAVLTTKNRDNAVTAFMAKVNSLDEQMAELRNEIEYHEHD